MIARDARPDDYATFTRLFLELAVPDPTPSPEAFEARIRPSMFLLCDGDTPLAYAWWDPFGTVARVTHVVVDPSARGRGLGRALMAEIGARARARGCTSWTLFVKPENTPAIRLYESCGMREVSRAVAMKIAWADVARVAGETGVDASVAQPGDDAAIEATFGTPPGQMALFRAHGRALLQLREGGSVVGYAAFDPTFPGAMPFRVKRPGLARALLEAMRPHALPEHDHVRMTAEDGDDEAAAMVAAGAEVVLDCVKMAGPIAIQSAGAVP